MSAETISTISIAVNLVVGGILFAQIRSQKQIMKQYKTYIETLDINKFKDYMTVIEDMGDKKVQAEKINSKLEQNRNKEEIKAYYEKYYNEVVPFLLYQINNMKMDYVEKMDLVKGAFPLTFPLIKDRIH